MSPKRIKTRTKKFNVPRSIHNVYPQVKFVVDADEPIDVKVCVDDLKGANKKDPTTCAMARAMVREHKIDAAVIGMASSYIIKGDLAIRFETPESVQREIVSFDRHHDFMPGKYHLRPKSPTMRLGANKRPYKGSHEPGDPKKAKRIHHTENVRVMPKGQA